MNVTVTFKGVHMFMVDEVCHGYVHVTYEGLVHNQPVHVTHELPIHMSYNAMDTRFFVVADYALLDAVQNAVGGNAAHAAQVLESMMSKVNERLATFSLIQEIEHSSSEVSFLSIDQEETHIFTTITLHRHDVKVSYEVNYVTHAFIQHMKNNKDIITKFITSNLANAYILTEVLCAHNDIAMIDALTTQQENDIIHNDECLNRMIMHFTIQQGISLPNRFMACKTVEEVDIIL